MKKNLWIPIATAIIATVFTACLKNQDDVVQCVPNTLEQDREVIDSFIIEEGIAYLTFNPDKYYYEGISNPGPTDSAMAEEDSIIIVKQTISAFKGMQLIQIANDTINQNNSGTPLKYSDVKDIPELNYLLTNVRKGGSVKFIYPSAANVLGGFGCQQQDLTNGVSIPAYAQIMFDYTLIDVIKE